MKNKEGKNEWRIEEIQERSQEAKNEEAKKPRMKKPRSRRIKKHKKPRMKKPRRTPRTPRTKNHTRSTSNTSQSSIPPYSTNPSQLLPSLYNSSRTFEPIQTFYNFLIYIILLCFDKV